MEYFKNNSHEKEHFDEIMHIRERIKQLELDIEKLKAEALVMFKRKFDHMKNVTNSQSVRYELVYAALFGNYIVV